jgi:hypothetical protein
VSITITVGAVLGPIILTVMLFTLYLSYCALNAAYKSGKLASTPLPVRGVCWAIFIVALVLDVIFNITVGTLAFLELPELRRLTFTMRCKKHMTATGYRGRLARWVCEGWLNPFEDGHC